MPTTVNIYEAKKNLSKLVDSVVNDNQDVIICKYGNPMARIIPVQKAAARPQEGFAKEYLDSINFEIPNNFDTLMQDEIAALFEGASDEDAL